MGGDGTHKPVGVHLLDQRGNDTCIAEASTLWIRTIGRVTSCTIAVVWILPRLCYQVRVATARGPTGTAPCGAHIPWVVRYQYLDPERVELIHHPPNTSDTARHGLKQIKLRSIIYADIRVCMRAHSGSGGRGSRSRRTSREERSRTVAAAAAAARFLHVGHIKIESTPP
jgi:hypothetical protein